VGSATLSERLDPEDLRDLLSAYQRTCREAVGRHGGHVAQYLGDGVMAYFGYPRVHEDDSVRAMRAARRILEGLSDVNAGIGRRLQAEVQVRIGLHTGLVVVGEIGPGGVHDRLAVGDTVNLAARIQSLAEPGAIVASAATARLVRGYVELRALGPRTLKGFSLPVEVVELLEETGARSRLEAAAASGLTPYVGRRRELSALVRSWQEVRLGAERAVLVRGEAGIGKSRLVDTFRKTALQDSSSVLECFCTQLTQGTALAPVITMMERRLDEEAGSSSPRSRLEVLRSTLGEHSRFGPEALPLMASLLSLPGVDEAPLAGMSFALRRTQTLAVLRTWLSFVSERVPTLLLFEDLHWADTTTLELLELLVRAGGGDRMLLCATSRPEFQPGWAGNDALVMELRRLDHADAEALAVHVAGGRALPAGLAFRIVERSEGVPLFVEELTRAVLQSGALVDRGDRYEFSSEQRLDAVPAAMADSLLARFDRLGASRPVAQLAAAIGREFSYDLLLATTGQEETELRQHLDLLVESGLILSQGEAPASSYLFKHALVHEAVYGTHLKKNRREAHARILHVLKSRFQEWLALHPEAGAYHAEEAGSRREAIDYLKIAGLRALAQLEAVGAARHLSRALELVDAVEEPERSRLELELVTHVSQAYIAVHGHAHPETKRMCERALDLARRSGDEVTRLMAMNNLCTVLIVRGELHRARAVARELMESPVAAANPLLRCVALQAESNALYYQGYFEEARRAGEEGIEIFEREKDRSPAVRHGVPLTALCFAQSAALALEGQLEQSAARIREWEERLRLYRSLDSMPKGAAPVNFTTLAVARASSPLHICVVLYLLRDLDRAPAMAASSVAIAEAERLPLWYSIAKIFLAFDAGLRRADAGQGAEELRRAVAAYQATGARVGLSFFVGMLATLLLRAGKAGEALEVLVAESDRIEPEHELNFQPEILRLQCEALHALERREESAQRYRQAIDAARALGARTLSLRATAGLYRLTGDASDGALLQREVEGFTEGFGFADLREARALLGTDQRMAAS
jgi:class 3 adenylate cyclase